MDFKNILPLAVSVFGRESSSAPATPMKSSKKLNSESSSGDSSDNSELQFIPISDNYYEKVIHLQEKFIKFYTIIISGEENRTSVTVSVPRPDDETFTNFFSSLSLDKCKDETLDLSENDFDSVTSVSKL